MKEKSIYIADDGKEFGYRYECQVYEDELHAPRRKVLKDYILFFYGNNTRAPYSPFREPSFVYVKQIPDDDNPVKEIWDEVWVNGTIFIISSYFMNLIRKLIIY